MFAQKTVDGVLTTFRKAVEDLRAIDEQQRLKVSKINDSIMKLQDERNSAVNEAERARAVADNISKLIAA